MLVFCYIYISQGSQGTDRKNVRASWGKAYQGKISKHADLSFEKNGISFDAIVDGKLVDAKFGYGKSTFADVLDEEAEIWIPEVINDRLRNALLASVKRQQRAIEGTGLEIEWCVSNDLAQRGIEQLFKDNGIIGISVKYVNP